MEGFIWKNIKSVDMFLITDKLPPKNTSVKRVEKIIIPGRSGFLTRSDGAYEGDVKTVEFHHELAAENPTTVDMVKAWLSGSGEVIFGNQDDRYYKATIINQISLDEVIPILHKGIVLFDCQPFGYLLEGTKTITISTSGSTVTNIGNYYSEPYFKVFGSGNITLNINGKSIVIKSISSYIQIDTELDQFYKDTVSMEGNVTGECPILAPGANTIAWVGTVTKIEIIPRWRCL